MTPEFEPIAWWRKPVKAFGKTHRHKPGETHTLCGRKIPTNKKTSAEGTGECPKCFGAAPDRIQEEVEQVLSERADVGASFEKYVDPLGNDHPPDKWFGYPTLYLGNIPPGRVVWDTLGKQLTVLRQGVGSTRVIAYRPPYTKETQAGPVTHSAETETISIARGTAVRGEAI